MVGVDSSKFHLPAMVAKVTSAAGRERGSRGRAPGRLRSPREGSGILSVGDRGAGQLSTKVESRVLHGGHVLATRRPLKDFAEQVSGDEVSKVGTLIRASSRTNLDMGL